MAGECVSHSEGGAPEKRTKRVAVRRWSCPNHPDGPPTLPADGLGREELTLAEAFDDDVVQAFVAVVRAARRQGKAQDASLVEHTFGTCCVGREWVTVGYETVEVTAFEVMLRDVHRRFRPVFETPVLLAELAKGSASDGAPVNIPLVSSEGEAPDE